MKSVLKVCSIQTNDDVSNIKTAISNNLGVIACEINTEKGEVSVVYDDFFVRPEKLIQSLEDSGYTVL
ncbi:MAG TPA: heavy-metal-associated domain-containing protein [Clostridiaceae bacterium]